MRNTDSTVGKTTQMDLPVRKRNRLKYYDYSRPGAYFITICTKDRRKILSKIVGDGSPVPKNTTLGLFSERTINGIKDKYPSVTVDMYVIMPNHIHMILVLTNTSGTGNPSPTVGNVVAWFKYSVTKAFNKHYGVTGKRIFQRSFHDHVIRSRESFMYIRNYIQNNPKTWEYDCFYPQQERTTP